MTLEERLVPLRSATGRSARVAGRHILACCNQGRVTCAMNDKRKPNTYETAGGNGRAVSHSTKPENRNAGTQRQRNLPPPLQSRRVWTGRRVRIRVIALQNRASKLVR